jgi:hypothetical protein
MENFVFSMQQRFILAKVLQKNIWQRYFQLTEEMSCLPMVAVLLRKTAFMKN